MSSMETLSKPLVKNSFLAHSTMSLRRCSFSRAFQSDTDIAFFTRINGLRP